MANSAVGVRRPFYRSFIIFTVRFVFRTSFDCFILNRARYTTYGVYVRRRGFRIRALTVLKRSLFGRPSGATSFKINDRNKKTNDKQIDRRPTVPRAFVVFLTYANVFGDPTSAHCLLGNNCCGAFTANENVIRSAFGRDKLFFQTAYPLTVDSNNWNILSTNARGPLNRNVVFSTLFSYATSSFSNSPVYYNRRLTNSLVF